MYELLPQNVSFPECFWRSHIYFIRYCNDPTEITRNHFCDVFLKNQKYLRKKFLRRLIDVTERHLFWDILETPQRRHTKDISFEMFLRHLKDVTKKTSLLRCSWEVSEISLSMEIWQISQRHLMPAGLDISIKEMSRTSMDDVPVYLLLTLNRYLLFRR